MTLPRRFDRQRTSSLAHHLLPFLAPAVLCCGQTEGTDDDPPAPAIAITSSDAEDLPPMPSIPDAERGHLVAVSAGDYPINGSWEAQAGRCSEIGILEMYAGPSGLGTGMLVRISPGDPVGTYPVHVPSFDLPDPPAVLVAVQAFNDPEAFGFQAYEGQLELTVLGETVSGRFETTLREISTDMLAHYVGIFEDVPVAPLLPEYCQRLRDSIVGPDSAATADSVSPEG